MALYFLCIYKNKNSKNEQKFQLKKNYSRIIKFIGKNYQVNQFKIIMGKKTWVIYSGTSVLEKKNYRGRSILKILYKNSLWKTMR